HVHDIVWWEDGVLTVLADLLLLCPRHHRAIHDRHWALTGTAEDHVFRRPDGVIADPAAARLCGSTAELVAAHRRHGPDITIDATTTADQWTGGPIHWDCFDAAFANGRSIHDPYAGEPPSPN